MLRLKNDFSSNYIMTRSYYYKYLVDISNIYVVYFLIFLIFYNEITQVIDFVKKLAFCKYFSFFLVFSKYFEND